MNDVIFWNVDTQYDFMRDDASFNGALPVPEARGIEDKLRELTNYATEHGIRVVNTADWHNEHSKEFSDQPDYQTTFPVHCLQGTKGAEYVPATQPDNSYNVDWQDPTGLDLNQMQEHRNITIYKDAFDVFEGNSQTENVLAALNPKTAVVYGVATNVCVDYAVIGLRARGVDVLVPTDAIKELPGLPLDETLRRWEQAGATLCTVETLIEYLS